MEYNKGYGTSTHQPLIRGVLDLYKPRFILELGIGLYSTPLFIERVNNNPSESVRYFGIENDAEWIAEMEAKLDVPAMFMHHAIDIPIDMPEDDLRASQGVSLEIFYNSLIIPPERPNLLFVDNYASCRVIAMNCLQEKFDIVIFHDCEPNAVSWYRWDLLKKGISKRFYLTSYESWTGLSVKEDKGLNRIKMVVEPYIKEYEKEMGDVNMKLIDDDGHI